MKTGRASIIIGWVMIVFNIIGYFGRPEMPPPGLEGEARIGFYIGFNIFFIIGIILLITGYRSRRKAKIKQAKNDLLDNFLNDSSKNTGS